jgi:hypothetical protein
VHLPKVKHILGGIFPLKDKLESFDFFSLKGLGLKNIIKLQIFEYV